MHSAAVGLGQLLLALDATLVSLVEAPRGLDLPGPFMTDVTKAWDLEAFDRQAQRHIPLRRGGQPSEIVGAALYLATEASSYTTGAVIKVDGGAAYAPA